MRQEPLRILVVGAHPDDCDIKAGGCAVMWARAGHQVQFLSCTDGAAGHHEIGGIELAQRRYAEAQAVAKVAGISYTVWDEPDGELMVTLGTRHRMVRAIREFRPHLVLAPRPNDYHPDHRAAGQLVQDASYMVTVPNHVPSVPALREDPVIAYTSDHFRKPAPFEPNVVIAIDSVIDVKLEMLLCHESQVFEWLPYNGGVLDQVPAGAEERRAWVRDRWLGRNEKLAERYRALLTERYGAERAAAVGYVEAFEVSEYGAELTPELAKELFPF